MLPPAKTPAMIRRLLASGLLSLCLVLTGLAATLAEARMAAAGGYCGSGHPEILLDRVGLPLFDGAGHAIAAPDCPLCALAAGLPVADPPFAPAPRRLVHRSPTLAAPPFLPGTAARTCRHARAPPVMA